MANWKTRLDKALQKNGETWADVEHNTMSDADMAKEFDADYGPINGCAFTVWTTRSVYFPLSYDGLESVGRVSRHPDGKPTAHLTGDSFYDS